MISTVFYMVLFYALSKAETIKRTMLQMDNIFQFSDEKATCLTQTQIKILGIPRSREIN